MWRFNAIHVSLDIEDRTFVIYAISSSSYYFILEVHEYDSYQEIATEDFKNPLAPSTAELLALSVELDIAVQELSDGFNFARETFFDEERVVGR